MTKAAKSGLIVFISCICVILLITGMQIFSSHKRAVMQDETNVKTTPNTTKTVTRSIDDSKRKKSNGNSASKEYIASIRIEGTIEQENYTYNQNWILNTIKNLKNDSNNLGLAIFINSPGGAVYQADEVYLALQDYKTAGKKIYVYQGPMAASGGYYISCAGDKIYANRNTMTGSIGVIAGQFIDVTELLYNLGIETETIHSGRNKLLGSATEPITDEQREIMQEICDECYNQFVSIVVSQRHLSFSTVEELADGRIYTAFQALENGLIDQIDSWDNMLDNMMDNEFGHKCKVISYNYKAPFRAMDIIKSSISEIQDKEAATKLGVPASIMKEINGFNSYPAYLYK